MEAFFVSTGIVALAEIGDKTQLLALLLAVRFRHHPWPIVLGIFVATVANHALAGALGQLVASVLTDTILHSIVAVSFIAVAAWALVPDKLEEDTAPIGRYGAFMATLVAFFIAEMGDKTQIATVVLAAQFADYFWVVLGTTLGMMLANVPVVFLGNAAAGRLPLDLIRRLAAGAFLLLGLYSAWLAYTGFVSGGAG
ncbi:TMEM165/GDT1 family protein [Pseudomonas saliphila]|uniref:TMEM165/GDT1 family protein n=1 Tax=Pseudomonas saliphila TaxID=2586906 RepID=UPI00123AD2F7|nr:TMEM165/GDT1 family protein [Pseudomonas saliphila]